MVIYLAHGASGNADSMRPHVDGLVRRGLDARAVSLPVNRAERAVPVYRDQVTELRDAVIGGHSYGGRVACLLASEDAPRALVLLSYPLHRPGKPEWETRVDHWPKIGCPVLLLSGDADPFARIDLLQLAVGRLKDAQLVIYPGVRHGLKPVLDKALDRIAAFVGGLG
jgi:predicted alpha/beta-hydrolase family hydrolase